MNAKNDRNAMKIMEIWGQQNSLKLKMEPKMEEVVHMCQR